MIRGTSLAILALIGLIGVGLFHVTFEVREMEEQLSGLNHDILSEQEAIHVLRAEWSYLNRPDRLEELNARFLKLGDVPENHVLQVSDLPFRPLLDDGPKAGERPVLPESAPLPALPDPSQATRPTMASAEVTQ